MNTSLSDGHEAVVIGAGQAGLAAGYHLARRGIDFTILEASNRVGDVWRERYDSLRLYSPAKYNALPGLPFPLSRSAFPTGRQMADYLETYADHHQLPVETGVRIDRLRASSEAGDRGYAISAGDRRYEANQVIVATGAFQRTHVPDIRWPTRSPYPPAPLGKLPRSAPTRGRSGSCRGPEPLRRRHRLRGG